jgi:iron complex transport system permease protein
VKRATSRQLAGLTVLVILVIIVAVLRLMIDRDPVTGDLSLKWPDAAYARFRLTALIVGAIVGAALATAGVLLQALLRNPLASPFILGVSSGAGLGVITAAYLAHGAGIVLVAGNSLPACCGGLAALAIVYALGRRSGCLDPVSLVLVGVVVSTIAGAGIMFFQHLVDTGLLRDFTRWMMGTIPETIDPREFGGMAQVHVLSWAGGITLAGIVFAAGMGRAMDAATLGDEEARTVGVSVGRLRVVLFTLAGVLTALTVALAGPLAFVGLIAPHAGRLILGPAHRPLVVGSALVGIAIVVGADVARQAIDIGGGRMPIGVFTACIGGPAFIWLLKSGRGQA